MSDHQSKQRKTTPGGLRHEKVQNLPLRCVEAICKFSPTSKLARLYSNAVPLPGAFWSFGLKNVLKDRLPFSFTDDLPYHQAITPAAIFDAAGSEVASVKAPEAFRFSPIRELIARATLCVRAVPSTGATDKMPVYVEHGEAILSHLPRATELFFVFQHIGASRRKGRMEDRALLERQLKHLLPRLHVLTVRICDGDTAGDKRLLDTVLSDYLLSVALPQMNGLRRLDIPASIFSSIMVRATANASARLALRRALSALRSLGVWQEWSVYCAGQGISRMRPSMLQAISSHCGQLSTLTVLVEGEFRAYLAAFRALTSLSSLGLYLTSEPDLRGLAFSDSEAVGSVLDLRVMADSDDCSRAGVLAISSLFPSTKDLAVELGEESRDVLQLAVELCTKRTLPAVEKLSCFYPEDVAACTGECLTEFIASSRLPEAIDLSPMIFSALAKDPGLLTGIYCAMQGNATKSLLLRGPVHADALLKLQGHIDLHGENAKVIAWKDRDLGDQPGILNRRDISQQTEFKIVGMKTAGHLMNEQFIIRVMHQLSKRSGIF